MKTCVDGADAIASKLAPTRFMRDVQDFRITESPLWEILWLRESPQLAFG